MSRAPFDPADPQTQGADRARASLVQRVRNHGRDRDARAGQPFDNSMRFYTGSGNDFALNRLVRRYRADPRALQEMEAGYQTSGRLAAPLVTLHTTGDPIVPYWHEPLYSWKALLGGSGLQHVNLPVLRYGHCRFEAAEAIVSLGLLVLKVEGQDLPERREGPDDGEGPQAVPVAGQGERPAALKVASLNTGNRSGAGAVCRAPETASGGAIGSPA